MLLDSDKTYTMLLPAGLCRGGMNEAMPRTSKAVRHPKSKLQKVHLSKSCKRPEVQNLL